MKLLILTSILLVILSVGIQQSFTDSTNSSSEKMRGLQFSVVTDKQVYVFGDDVIISGTVSDAYQNRDDIDVYVHGPFGNLREFFTLDIDDNGEFYHTWQIPENLMGYEGSYKISIGVERDLTYFYIFDSIPTQSVKIDPNLQDLIDVLHYYDRTDELLHVRIVFDEEQKISYDKIRNSISQSNGELLSILNQTRLSARIPLDLVYSLIDDPQIIEIRKDSAFGVSRFLPPNEKLSQSTLGYGMPQVYYCDSQHRITASLDLKYKIENASVNSICGVNQDFIQISINATSRGHLFVDIPRSVSDSIGNACESLPFGISIYPNEAHEATESFGDDGRTLFVPFTENTSLITIHSQTNLNNAQDLVKNCNLNYYPGWIKFHSPLKQIESGNHPKYIKCNIGYKLIHKITNDAPVCIKHDSVQRLIDRGWASYSPSVEKISNTKISDKYGEKTKYYMNTFGELQPIHYVMEKGDVNSIKMDYDLYSLFLKLNHDSEGAFRIVIPRTIIDATVDGKDDSFIVLVDGNMIEFNTTRNNLNSEFNMILPKNSETVEIIGKYGLTSPILFTNTYDIVLLNKSIDTIPYRISNGEITNMSINPVYDSIVVTLDVKGDGSLSIGIPNELHKNSMRNLMPFPVTVLIDGDEGEFDLSKRSNLAVFTVNFSKDTKSIEILPYLLDN